MRVRIPKKYSNLFTRLNRYLKAHKKRPSPVRNMVLEQVCMLHQPFTAEQLIEVCAPERISVATVYNALNLFADANVIRVVPRKRGQTVTQYEVMQDHMHRMQFVCLRCGRMSNFADKAIAQLVDQHKYPNFLPRMYSMMVYGECKMCRRKA